MGRGKMTEGKVEKLEVKAERFSASTSRLSWSLILFEKFLTAPCRSIHTNDGTTLHNFVHI